MSRGDQTDQPTPTGSTLSGLRVLLVDDDELVAGFLNAVLSKHGAQVYSVASLAECHDVLATTRFDVVLMDFNLPDAGGCEAASTLLARQSPERPLRIIGLSGEPAELARPRALEAGMDDYLEKPVTAHELVACLIAYRSRPIKD